MADSPGDDRTLRSDHPSAHHVDVQEAELIFDELSRALSRQSKDPEKSRTANSSPSNDVEKGEEDERFDLREYLQSSNDANQGAGIKHKHVGVTWEDLEVDVFGGEDNKVRVPYRMVALSKLLIVISRHLSVLRVHFRQYVAFD